jgi:hypothetical protein
VTFFAGGLFVLADQFEVGKVVIEFGGLPTFRRMAAFTIPPKPPVMFILIEMAGEAILRL